MGDEPTERIYVHGADASTATTTPPAGVDLAGWWGLDVTAVRWAQFRHARQMAGFKLQEATDAEQAYVDLLGELQAKVDRARTGEPEPDPEPDEGEVPADD
jgi:hypothetical protein